jgi:hypothetical protein
MVMEINIASDIDIFRNVHKGLRSALFAAVQALGRAPAQVIPAPPLAAQLREVLHFLTHHAENENLLLPLLETKAPQLAQHLRLEHERLERQVLRLRELISTATCVAIHSQWIALTASYLLHMQEEEDEYESQLRSVLSRDEIAWFARTAVERTSPADQRMMLGYILPAIEDREATAFLQRLPPALAAELRTRLERRA